MKIQISSLAFSILVTAFCACTKDQKTDPCSAPTSRVITNKRAVVKINTNTNEATIVEQGTLDTWLIPCNLPQDFYQNDLQVVISGEAKETRFPSGICCPQHFFITKISR